MTTATTFPKYETLTGSWTTPHIFHLQLNRPDEMNAMNPKFFEELVQAFDFLNKQEELRVVILTANGKHFCSGLDLKEAGDILNHEGDDVARKTIKSYESLKFLQYSISSLNRCRVPVIAGVHGVCVGGAIDLISAADIRYCTKDSKFTIKEVDIGICADLGTVQRLPQLTGNDSLLRELNYTGRFFTSEEATQLGLVSKVTQSREELLKELNVLAETIASKSPVAVWTIKQALNHDLNRIVTPNIEYMARVNSSMLFTTDLQESVSAFLTKKKPLFPKL